MTTRRCRILSADGRSSCATCGETWSAREAHVCPDKRAIRPSSKDVDVLVAMLTRVKPLVRTRRGSWFVPDWGVPDVRNDVVERLIRAGHLKPGDRGSVRVLTEAGRAAALAACSPETRARLAA